MPDQAEIFCVNYCHMDAKTAGIHSSQKVILKKFKGDAEKIKENNLEIDPASDFALKLTYKNFPKKYFFEKSKITCL